MSKNCLYAFRHSLLMSRIDAQEAEQRCRDEVEAEPSGPARAALRIRHWRAQDRLESLNLQVDLATRAVTMSATIEQQRTELSHLYIEHDRRPVKTELALQVSRGHDQLARSEARLRRLTRSLVELSVGPSWTPTGLQQFEDDDELLASEDKEPWPVIPELLSRRMLFVH